MRAVIAAVLLLLAMPVLAQEWVRYGSTLDAGSTFHYVPSTVRVTGSLRRVWQLQNLREPDSRTVQSRRVLSEFDCKQERMRTLSFEEFDGPLAMGSIVTSQTYDPPGNWGFIAPGSIGYTLLQLVCAAKK
jgi:hypothetical protein